MTAYRPPDFRERAELARQAKLKAVEKLRARGTLSEAELAERKAARLQREAEAEAARVTRAAEAAAAKEERARQREAEAAEAKARVENAALASTLSEAEKKAARDARYAARKNRK
jgi:hypothetical protein